MKVRKIVGEMSADGGVKVAAPVETVESLMKEAEVLKAKLEEERQKLNDVTCKISFLNIIFHVKLFFCKNISI